MIRYIGIDPGASGGIAFIESSWSGDLAFAIKQPETDRDIWNYLSSLRDAGGQKAECFAMLEKVHAMPKQGVSSTFTFGQNYGKLQMALIASGIPFEHVTPQKWQKALQCLTGGDKNVSKSKAQELFPHLRITHATADALLLAEYCRRTRVDISTH